MKKIAFALVVLFVLFSFVPVRAMETKNYTGSATSSNPYLLDITTLRDGDLTAQIVWVPRRNVNYIFQVFHYTDPNNVYNSRDFNFSCTMASYQLLTSGNWTCHFTNAPAGYYRIYFRPYNGGAVSFNLSLTAETNP